MKKLVAPAALIAVLSLVTSGAAAPVAAAPPAGTTTGVVVEVGAGADPAAVAAKHGIVTTHLYSEVLDGFAAKVTARQLGQLRADGRVAAVTVDRVWPAAVDPGDVEPGDDRFSPGPAPDPAAVQPAQGLGTQIRRVGADVSPTADIDGTDDRRVDADIAIVDTGVDAYHPDLNVVGGFDCVSGRSDGYGDTDGHGTMVAGYAAAIDNTIGTVGIAPGARIWAVRVIAKSGVSDSTLLCGMEYVIGNPHIDVVNMSLGGLHKNMGPCLPPRRGKGDLLHQAICRIAAQGKTIVASAGNEGVDASQHTPSAYEEVIAVSALVDFDGVPGGLTPPPTNCWPEDVDDTVAVWSNYGPTVDIAAPGVCITAPYPGGLYARGDGTSFAAPQVAGAAALLLSQNPELTPAQVRQRILDAAEPGPIPGDPDAYPEGVLNVSTF